LQPRLWGRSTGWTPLRDVEPPLPGPRRTSEGRPCAGHYRWEEFQHNLIQKTARWEDMSESERGNWQYYDHWVAALETVIATTD
jgi:hypothetical protein